VTVPIVEGFSVTRASVLDGTTGAETAQIYGCRTGTLDIDSDSFDNTGDDTVLSTWQWFNFATVTIESGFLPYTTLALLTGATISSSGTAPNDWWHIPVWNISALNQQRRPLLLRCSSRSLTASNRFLDFVMYQVQFAPFKFDGPKYKDGLVVTYSGKCLMSSTDEKGAALTERSIGRIVSHP
jgi:hypothetical protein